MSTVTRACAIGVLLLASAAAGCSSIAENVGERIAEEAMEAGIGSDVELDFDADGEGGVRVQTSDGEMAFGADVEVPAEWSGKVILPDGITLNSAFSESSEGRTTYSYTGTVSGDYEAVVDDLDATMIEAGYESTSQSDYTNDGVRGTSRTYTKGESSIQLLVNEDVDAGVMVFYTGEVSG